MTKWHSFWTPKASHGLGHFSQELVHERVSPIYPAGGGGGWSSSSVSNVDWTRSSRKIDCHRAQDWEGTSRLHHFILTYFIHPEIKLSHNYGSGFNHPILAGELQLFGHFIIFYHVIISSPGLNHLRPPTISPSFGLPSGKRLHNELENHHFQWVNPLFLAIFNSYFDITRG